MTLSKDREKVLQVYTSHKTASEFRMDVLNTTVLCFFADLMCAPREGSSRREEEGEPAEVTRCNKSDWYNKMYKVQVSVLYLLKSTKCNKLGGYKKVPLSIEPRGDWMREVGFNLWISQISNPIPLQHNS